MKALLATVFCLALSGCLGYHVGPVKPYYLRDVHTVAVPTFKNRTLIPRIEVLITDTVIKQFQQDGTFQIASGNNAEATLNGEIAAVRRTPARSVRGNVLATTEFALTLSVRYSLTGKNGEQLAPPNEVVGTTSFFVSNNSNNTNIINNNNNITNGDVTTDERQALPLATEDLATRLVSQISEGW